MTASQRSARESRVCFVSGGSGGHLLPALVLARELRARGHHALLITEGREVEREILKRMLPEVADVTLPTGRGRSWRLPIWLVRSVIAARRILKAQQVQCVVSTGGRPSLPVGIAARSLGLPLYLLEQNAVIGRANRLLLPFAQRMFLGLPLVGSQPKNAMVVGTPVREELGVISRADARAALGLDGAIPVVLVTGGSQGARALNSTVVQALTHLPMPVQVLHLSGLGNDVEVRRRYASASPQLRVQVRPVAVDMDRMYAAADLVICRGGGTTVAELSAVGRAALIVPYPHHRDQQQVKNAAALAALGAAVLVNEADLKEGELALQLARLLRAPDELAKMASAARSLRTAQASARILHEMGFAAPQPLQGAQRTTWGSEGAA